MGFRPASASTCHCNSGHGLALAHPGARRKALRRFLQTLGGASCLCTCGETLPQAIAVEARFPGAACVAWRAIGQDVSRLTRVGLPGMRPRQSRRRACAYRGLWSRVQGASGHRRRGALGCSALVRGHLEGALRACGAAWLQLVKTGHTASRRRAEPSASRLERSGERQSRRTI